MVVVGGGNIHTLFVGEEKLMGECSSLLHNVSLETSVLDKWIWSFDDFVKYAY